MNLDRFEGNWTDFKGNLKSKWGKLSDNDLTQIDGNAEALAGKLQDVYGKQEDEAKHEARSAIGDVQATAWSEKLHGDWGELKGTVQKKWGKLTDNQLTAINGDANKLAGTLQKDYGYDDAQTASDMRGFFKDLK